MLATTGGVKRRATSMKGRFEQNSDVCRALSVGSVYYVTDGRTGAPLSGWPPKLQARGIRRPPRERAAAAAAGAGAGAATGDGGVAGGVGEAIGKTKGRGAVLFPGARRAGVRDGPSGGGGSGERGGTSGGHPDDAEPAAAAAATAAAASTSAAAASAATYARAGIPDAAAAESLGASTYFMTFELAAKYADKVARPLGLVLFPRRRRLLRPSDIPSGPIAIGCCPMGDAYSRGLHSSAFQLNLSAFSGIGGAFMRCFWGCLGDVTGHYGVLRA